MKKLLMLLCLLLLPVLSEAKGNEYHRRSYDIFRHEHSMQRRYHQKRYHRYHGQYRLYNDGFLPGPRPHTFNRYR